MRRIGTSICLAMSLLACGSSAPSGDPVALLTASTKADGCYTFQVTDTLVTDARYGTLVEHHGVPVMWPLGYTGRRMSSGEVVVLDPSGKVVATTGHVYAINGGFATVGDVDVFLACDDGATEVTQ